MGHGEFKKTKLRVAFAPLSGHLGPGEQRLGPVPDPLGPFADEHDLGRLMS